MSGYGVYLFATASNGIKISHCKTRDAADFTGINHDALFYIFSIEIIPNLFTNGYPFCSRDVE